MDSALIISYTDNGVDEITRMLKSLACKNVSKINTCGEARRLLQKNEYDLYIINSPVYTESGEELAIDLVSFGTSQVVFIVKNDNYEYSSSKLESYGVLTMAKPFNRQMLYTILKLSKATVARLRCIQQKNQKLTKKIDDIKIVDRAKCILISHLNMTEAEAHKFIEKKSMDNRTSRRAIAENILRTYES